MFPGLNYLVSPHAHLRLAEKETFSDIAPLDLYLLIVPRFILLFFNRQLKADKLLTLTFRSQSK